MHAEAGISPAMSPKVLSKSGKEVYGSAAVERDFASKIWRCQAT